MSAKPEMILLTDAKRGFGQLLQPWESVNVDLVVRELSARYAVRVVTYEQIASGAVLPAHALIIHSSSQQPEYKQYIDDILLYLHGLGNNLVPSIHVTRSHENKGYQEFYKRMRGLADQGPAGDYLCSPDWGVPEYPIVFKELVGFGSYGVKLLRNRADLERFARSREVRSVRQTLRALYSELGFIIRKHILRKSNLRPYGDYYKPRKRFVLQQLIPDLTHDYKVIVSRKRVFVLKRRARPSDFRASGSGLFSFEEAPAPLLDFALRILTQFEEPYLSLDVCFDGQRFYLIEFQGVHFGPYTVMKAPFHYRRRDNGWERSEESVQFEEFLAWSLIDHLDAPRQTDVGSIHR